MSLWHTRLMVLGSHDPHCEQTDSLLNTGSFALSLLTNLWNYLVIRHLRPACHSSLLCEVYKRQKHLLVLTIVLFCLHFSILWMYHFTWTWCVAVVLNIFSFRIILITLISLSTNLIHSDSFVPSFLLPSSPWTPHSYQKTIKPVCVGQLVLDMDLTLECGQSSVSLH